MEAPTTVIPVPVSTVHGPMMVQVPATESAVTISILQDPAAPPPLAGLWLYWSIHFVGSMASASLQMPRSLQQ